mmetsp:Transcript_11169/g.21242  ORF Transcript_11169/g.21242 Transcript_11169/m.21242 type:complete len:241 (+) Transcript_11169:1947-2669(+)
MKSKWFCTSILDNRPLPLRSMCLNIFFLRALLSSSFPAGNMRLISSQSKSLTCIFLVAFSILLEAYSAPNFVPILACLFRCLFVSGTKLLGTPLPSPASGASSSSSRSRCLRMAQCANSMKTILPLPSKSISSKTSSALLPSMSSPHDFSKSSASPNSSFSTTLLPLLSIRSYMTCSSRYWRMYSSRMRNSENSTKSSCAPLPPWLKSLAAAKARISTCFGIASCSPIKSKWFWISTRDR